MKSLVLIAVVLGATLARASDVTIHDTFGRDVTERGITLLDWEGQIANPTIRLTIEASASSDLRTLDIRSDCPRLIFDRAGDVSNGPLGKSIRLPQGETKAAFWVSIFPDRDGKDEDHLIEIRLRGDKEWTPLKVHVIDQDKDLKPKFNFITDYSADKTGFLKDKKIQQVINQAASDWGLTSSMR